MTTPLDPNDLLRVLFIDAGPTRNGWILIVVRRDGCIVPTQGGYRGLALDATWLRALMEDTWRRGGVVGLEYIDGGLYDRKRWQQLLETGRVEGDIRRIARDLGGRDVMCPFREMPAMRRLQERTLFCVPASSWRAELCGHGTATNAEIAVFVTHLLGRRVEVGGSLGTARVVDVPGIDSESREHIYDAGGGALVLAAAILQLKLQVPDEVRARAAEARAQAGRRRAIRRKLEQLGVDPSRATFADGSPVEGKRKPTRGQRAERRTKGANTRARRP